MLNTYISYCILECIDKSKHIEDYLTFLHNQLEGLEQKDLIRYITDDLKQMTEKLSRDFLIWNQNKKEFSKVMVNNISTFDKYLESIIRHLDIFPIPKNRPELYYFIYGMAPNVKALKPIISTQLTVYNFIALEFAKTIKGLKIPRTLMLTPDCWGVCAHELGHMVYYQLNNGNKDGNKDDTLINNWYEEIFSDLFGLKILGIGYLQGFLGHFVLLDPLFPIDNLEKIKTKHPTNLFRLKFMKKCLDNEKFREFGIFKKLNLNRLIKDYEGIYKENLSKLGKNNEDLKNCEDKLNEKINSDIESDIEKALNKLEARAFSNTDLAKSNDLAEVYLENKTPIGVYQYYTSNKINPDSPNSIPILFNAFEIVKSRELYTLYEELFKNFENALKNYFECLCTRNEFFLKSIEISEVCKFYKFYES